MRHILLGLVVLLVANIGMADQGAQSQRLHLQSLHFIGDWDDKPECYIDDDGNVVGSDVDIIRELGKRLKIKIDIELVPWVRVLSMIESGKADGGFPLFMTTARENFALYTKVPIHVSVMTVYTKSESEFEYKDFKDLYKKRIGINRGYSISNEFDLAAKAGDIEIVEVETIDQLTKMLINDRLDAIVSSPSSIGVYLDEKGVELSAIGHVRSRPAYLTLSKMANIKDKEKLLEKINQTLLVMEQDGTIEEITNRYQGF